MEAFSAPMYVAFRGPLQASCESFAPVAYQTQASMCPAKMIANTVPMIPSCSSSRHGSVIRQWIDNVM